jgi:hypothetical protein
MKKLEYIFKSTLLLTLAFVLSGCLLTESFKSELIEEHQTQKKLSKIEHERAELAAEKSEIHSKINELERLYTLEELQNSVKDFEVLRPSIVRLIKLESDLSYITEFLRTKERPISFPADQFHNTTATKLPTFSDIIELEESNSELTKSTENTNDNIFSSSVASKTDKSGVEVNAAKPPMTVMSVNRPEIEPNNNKFFTDITRNATNRSNEDIKELRSGTHSDLPHHQASGLDNKFSYSNSISDSVTPSAMPKNECLNRDSRGSFSVHLASYKNDQNARRGWKNLSQKYSDTLCNLQPKIANVEVNGSDFYSLRAGPITDRDTAARLCQKIRQLGDYCSIAAYEGREL